MGRRIDSLRAWVAEDLNVKALGATALVVSAAAWGALAVWRAKDQDPGLATLGQVGFYALGGLACLLWVAACLAVMNWIWPKKPAAPSPSEPIQPAETTVEPPPLRRRIPVEPPAVPPPEPAPRRRSPRVGDRVADTRDGHVTYRTIKDPDSKIDPPYTPDEWIDGVTARLNAYHDDAERLAGKDTTTWNEWVLFMDEISRFALKHLAVPRQTDMIRLIEKQAVRGVGSGSPEAAKRAFSAAAALIAPWFPLTRYDLSHIFDGSTPAAEPEEVWDERPALQTSLSMVNAKMKAGQALLARFPQRDTFQGDEAAWGAFKGEWMADCATWDREVYETLGADDFIRHYATPHAPFKPGENVYGIVERKIKDLANAWQDLIARLDRLNAASPRNPPDRLAGLSSAIDALDGLLAEFVRGHSPEAADVDRAERLVALRCGKGEADSIVVSVADRGRDRSGPEGWIRALRNEVWRRISAQQEFDGTSTC